MVFFFAFWCGGWLQGVLHFTIALAAALAAHAAALAAPAALAALATAPGAPTANAAIAAIAANDGRGIPTARQSTVRVGQHHQLPVLL